MANIRPVSLCPAIADLSGRPFELNGLFCRAVIDCRGTAAPIGQANTQKRCKSKFARTNVLKFPAKLSSVANQCCIYEYCPSVSRCVPQAMLNSSPCNDGKGHDRPTRGFEKHFMGYPRSSSLFSQ